MTNVVRPAKSLKGNVKVPGDKSISHRSLIFGALAQGCTSVSGLLRSEDVFSTLTCLRQLGVEILEKDSGDFQVQGLGLHGFSQPVTSLNCGNSGTTIRLLLGLLAAQNLQCELYGDASLNKRPMKRVTAPLSAMGAEFKLREDNYPPVLLRGSRKLMPLDCALPVASAQVKSALLLAALLTPGHSRISGKIQSRDHTERMLEYFGANIHHSPEELRIEGLQTLHAQPISVPGDPSTAAFWAAAACIVPKSEIELENVLLNPTRTGFFEALAKMGAKIQTEVLSENGEPIGSVFIESSELKGIEISEVDIPSLIDEIPLIAILGTLAHGKTVVSGAEELRVKESDRIACVVKNLRALGVEIEERPDGFMIEGPQKISGGSIESFHDHRIAMAFSVAALVAGGPVEIHGSEIVSVSYPEFFNDLAQLRQ